MLSLIDRFKKKMSRPDKNGCIKWLGWKNHDGYGKFSVGKIYKFSHRAAYEFFVGPIPIDKYVLHKCDVRSCCNVDHLYVGTQKDNMKDCTDRNRLTQRKGSQNGRSKLTEANVKFIKNNLLKISCAALSRKFGVSESCIHDVKHGRSWTHIKLTGDK